MSIEKILEALGHFVTVDFILEKLSTMWFIKGPRVYSRVDFPACEIHAQT